MVHQIKLPLNTKTKQINIRVDEALKIRFEHKLQDMGVGQTEILEQLILVWLEHAEERSIRHLNGEECPISALIKSLAATANLEMSRTFNPQKG